MPSGTAAAGHTGCSAPAMNVRLLWIPVLALAVSACGERTLKDTATDVALQQRLVAPPADADADHALWNAVRVAYRYNDGALLWLDDARPRPQATALREAIAHASSDGLDPAQYDTRALATLGRVDTGLFSAERYVPAAAADVDVRLTLAAARLVRDLRGRVDAGAVGGNWVGEKRKLSVGKLVWLAANADDVEATLRRAAPPHPQYAHLRGAMARLRAEAAKGGWPTVPDSAAVPASRKNPDLAPFRARLAASGHYVAPAASGTTADAAADAEALREAVRRFQREHGLEDDGVPGKATIAAMNVTIEDRIRQLEVNLERMRWLPDDLGDTHVLVNVPTFHLEAIEDGRKALEMRVVTGRTHTPTPIFSDTMETVVFSPYWNVPDSIQRGEVLPELEKDPSYLERQNMEVVKNGQPVDPWMLYSDDPSIRIRQRPGSGNALGHVKFLFPNEHDVYLHDTPADALFARAGRSFSHGCVRVERPFELAQWVLRDQHEWTPAKIETAMHSGSERHVALAEKIPVHIVYFTAWAGPDGTVQFANDVYGHDARHAALVPAAWPPMPRAAAVATR